MLVYIEMASVVKTLAPGGNWSCLRSLMSSVELFYVGGDE
jgi:hypothetical protein